MTNIDSKQVHIRDIMTKKVISVSPEASIFDAVKIISEHNFDGLPVIDKDGKLLGIITEYDLIIKTTDVSSSFLQKILGEVYSKKTSESEDATKESSKEISSLRVSDVMNKEPLVLNENASFEEVISSFIVHHRVNPIPIVNDENKVVGIVSRYDILRPLNLLGYSTKK